MGGICMPLYSNKMDYLIIIRKYTALYTFFFLQCPTVYESTVCSNFHSIPPRQRPKGHTFRSVQWMEAYSYVWHMCWVQSNHCLRSYPEPLMGAEGMSIHWLYRPRENNALLYNTLESAQGRDWNGVHHHKVHPFTSFLVHQWWSLQKV